VIEINVLGRIFDSKRKKYRDAEENCIVMSFVMCTVCIIKQRKLSFAKQLAPF
jgi:hypothetical protein